MLKFIRLGTPNLNLKERQSAKHFGVPFFSGRFPQVRNRPPASTPFMDKSVVWYDSSAPCLNSHAKPKIFDAVLV